MNKNSVISERIEYMINILKLNKNEFAKKLGYKRSQSIYDILNNKSKPSYDFFEKLYNSEFSELINADWLFTGEGDILKEKTNNQAHLIPFYEGVAVGGTSIIADNSAQTIPAELINAGDWFRDATAAMRIHGESMEPYYKNGSVVALKAVFDKSLIIYGNDYVIETSEYRVLKRIQRSDKNNCWLCCSTNEEIYKHSGRLIHEPFDVEIDKVYRIYRVVGTVNRTESSSIIGAI
ncbi:MAG: hypothetical protein N4A49_06680 [Marinifilaceae bacterium]|jgi:transcriptional regulator with XRE-family HTH domain|nr:hypothetical protein [Marinifilaceae bacterium]